MHANKLIKAKYWTKWDGDIHFTTFEKRLDDEHICIKHFGINISDKNNLQFYLEQMYPCNQIDQTQMTPWENKIEAIKTNWIETKQYFEGLVATSKSTSRTAAVLKQKANTKVPVKPPKLTKATISGTRLPPLQQQRLSMRKSRIRLLPTFATSRKKKPMK